MRFRKHPLELNSFIIGKANEDDIAEMKEWLHENHINHNIQSNIVSVFDECSRNLFILRWLDS